MDATGVLANLAATPSAGARMTSKREPVPMCPIRPGDPCTLCEPGVTGPQDCGLVYLVMSDPDLRAELARIRRDKGSHVGGAPAGAPASALA